MNGRRGVLAALLALPVACAPLIDFDALTRDAAGVDAGRDGSGDAGVPDSHDGGEADANDADDTSDSGVDAFDTGDPCVAVPGADDGFYCGGTSHENGFAGGAANTLYGCVDGQAASANTCVVDCVVAPPTYPDTCDDCPSRSDGTWCGSEFAGYLKALANVKFTCTAGKNNGTPVACGGATPICHPQDGGATCVP